MDCRFQMFLKPLFLISNHKYLWSTSFILGTVLRTRKVNNTSRSSHRALGPMEYVHQNNTVQVTASVGKRCFSWGVGGHCSLRAWVTGTFLCSVYDVIGIEALLSCDPVEQCTLERSGCKAWTDFSTSISKHS